MIIGVPREVKEGEERVALTPSGAKTLSGAGNEVIVETNAGDAVVKVVVPTLAPFSRPRN